MKKTLKDNSKRIPLSAGYLLIALGVVYGDIGTSPLYVMKSVVSGNGGLAMINNDFIIGALSLVIWTITLVTTVKYVGHLLENIVFLELNCLGQYSFTKYSATLCGYKGYAGYGLHTFLH